MNEIPVDLNDASEFENVKSEIITNIFENEKVPIKIREHKKFQEYLANKIHMLLKLVQHTKVDKPSSVAESILLSSFPLMITCVIDTMKKYIDVSTEEELKKENKFNTDPFTEFSSASHALSNIGVHGKGMYIFSELQKEYTRNVETADRDTLNNDAVLFTDYINKNII